MDINNIPKEILDQIPPEFLDNLEYLPEELGDSLALEAGLW